ncbi:phosphomevalonate kinase-like protein, putative [Bodo saltans]|uniref:phosphomevalonate kinase n=1 Tax=Bodo saltans TaxID=75058 RepID=A0A0S4JMH3_BODSA|nr:phosphomevalonate kinase-like protein, putative [Bodo saltans]|eukprot:CUG90591.1 phosphomevalonate kinase-like protein, putative [Bodo saltans]
MPSASAPGKVLICGGYLVVESPNIGLSIGVSARFTTEVSEHTHTPSVAPRTVTVRVLSPQFRAEFLFVATITGEVVSVEQIEGPKSPFLLYGVLYAVACQAMLGKGDDSSSITVRLLASNDFYSQRNYLEERGEHVTVATLRSVPPHNPLVGDVSKTGLGSSAAMTTSFVACLLSELGVGDDTERIHRVAQVAHSVAQGKIGSGFDVFTATYGTCIYRRFPASCAEMMMQGAEAPTQVAVSLLHDCVKPEKLWVEPIAFPGLPKGLSLVLGDIHQGGSATPGMVAKVMAWRKSVKEVTDNLWDQLGAANRSYVTLLQELCLQASASVANHDAAVKRLSETVLAEATAEGSEESKWLEAYTAAGTCRRLLREVGHAAQVTIEPDSLTPLLNETAALPGVLAVGCPGAGGFDAVFALVLGEDGCARVESFWESYKGMEVCPLLVREDPRGLAIE